MEASQEIILRDGRTLCVAEYGDPKGYPIMYFHGWPSSRLEAGIAEEAARKLCVRLVAPDRPGFGRSTFKSGRTFVDWPDDVLELAEALEIGKFAVMGLSGGSPYAASCALRLPKRLTEAGIISGMGPTDAPGAVAAMRPLNRRLLLIGRTAPWLFGLFSWQTVRAMKHDPDHFFAEQLNDLPDPDQLALARPEFANHFLRSGVEAFRQGSRGAALENALYARPWGFQLADITMEVYLWHGELDINAPPAMGRHMAAVIPHCRSKFYEKEGHSSLIANHIEEIIATLSGG